MSSWGFVNIYLVYTSFMMYTYKEMKPFKNHLQEALEEDGFKEIYDEEKKIIELALKVHEARELSGLSQKEVSKKAHVTQQQLSKLENGRNCNMLTFLKVCKALNLNINFSNAAKI